MPPLCIHIIHIHLLLLSCFITCRYRITWSGDKDRFIVRFRDTNPGVGDFDSTFSRLVLYY